jgi:hypothetical protein
LPLTGDRDSGSVEGVASFRRVQLTMGVYTGAVVFLRSFSYGVSPARPPWGRLKL